MKIVVVGATNQIGHFLLPCLVEQGHEVVAVSRQSPIEATSVEWMQADLSQSAYTLPAVDAWIHLGPLPLLAPALVKQIGDGRLRRVLAFSSTSRLSKINSESIAEAKKARSLARAEEEVIALCEEHRISSTLFRPTLIYGCQKDKNVTFIANLIRRLGCFPIVGKGNGLRQPVHAEDLATACLQAIENPVTAGKIYELSGGQTLTYQEMIESIFGALNRKPRIVRVPLLPSQIALKALRVFPRFRHLTTAMLSRSSVDLCFPHEAASCDFGYDPRGFQPEFERLPIQPSELKPESNSNLSAAGRATLSSPVSRLESSCVI